MKFFKTTLVLILFQILISSISHKFYVSTTNVEYVPEMQTIQIISKIFVEDLEKVLQERYSHLIVLNPKKETKTDINYLRKDIQERREREQQLLILLNRATLRLEHKPKPKLTKEQIIVICKKYQKSGESLQNTYDRIKHKL